MNGDNARVGSEISSSSLNRRQLLRLTGLGGLGLLGLAVAACGPSGSPAAATSAPAPAATKPVTAPTAAPAPSASAVAGASPVAGSTAQTAPAQGGSTAAWDALVAAAQKEGKVTVSGPPSDDARKNLPDLMKKNFGIELEYLGGNSSQLASRIQSERAAGQYTIDVSMGGSDTMYRTFLENGWLDPIKPVLILPEVVDPNAWITGGPWFRDPKGMDTILQIFNTINPQGYLNADIIPQANIKSADDLLDPKYKGQIASYNPSVNGGGVLSASGLYASKGEDFIKNLYKNNIAALTRDYQQLADWAAHGNYPIGMGIRIADIPQYQGVVNMQQLLLPDVKDVVSGGFGMIGMYKNAPHPNAAKLYVNWIASKEGTTVYGMADGSAPIRTDVDASKWIPPSLIPKKGQDVVDSYEYTFVTTTRAAIQEMLAPIVGGAG
jgi:iron(III) transport system substrate-binding protein